MFFFLSGIGIGLSLKRRPSVKHFFSKRFNRIYPVFFIAVTIEHLIYNNSVIAYLFDVTTLSYWTPILNYDTKNTFWYVSAAFAFYIFSYPYYKCCFTNKPLLSTLLVSLLGLTLYYVLPLGMFLGRVPIYFIGMYTSLFLHRSFNTIPFVILSLVTYLAMGYVAFRYGGRTLSDIGLHFFAFIFITPGLVFFLTNIFKWLDVICYGKVIVKFVERVGKISLEFYFAHWIILCAINSFNIEIPWGVFVFLSLLLAYVLHILANLINKIELIRLKC